MFSFWSNLVLNLSGHGQCLICYHNLQQVPTSINKRPLSLILEIQCNTFGRLSLPQVHLSWHIAIIYASIYFMLLYSNTLNCDSS